MKYFTILLKSNKNRVNNVLNNLMKNIPNIEIIPAIEGKTNELEFYLEDRSIHSQYFDYCKRGELACLLSHLKVWKKIVKEEIPEAIILEDDAVIKENFLTEFEEIYQELPKDYDFLYLFVHPDTIDDDSSNSLKIKPRCSIYGTVGYLLTNNMAKELILLFENSINLSLDETLVWYLKETEKKYYSVNINLVETNGDLFRYRKEETELGSAIKETGFFKSTPGYPSFYLDQGDYLCYPCCDVSDIYYYDENHTLVGSKEKYLNNNNVLAFNSNGDVKNNLDDWTIDPNSCLYVKSWMYKNNEAKFSTRNKAILLTGGCGYIGSHCLLEFLLSRSEDIVIIDNLSNSNMENINKIKDLGNVFIYNADIQNKEDCMRIFSSHNISSVLHFAGCKSVSESIENPLKYYSNNVSGLLVLLKCMKKYRVKELIFSSSATVYGHVGDKENSMGSPVNEETQINILNPYGRSKYFCEEILKDVGKAYNINVICLRYFNPVGCYYLMPENSNTITNLFPRIISVIKGDLDYLSIYGKDYETEDGTAIRDYIHVIDLAKGHLEALKYFETYEDNSLNKNMFEIFNLGTGKGHSVLEIVTAFLKYVDKEDLPYEYRERREGDAPIIYADCTKAKNLLDWEAKLTLEDMVKDSLQK